MASVHVAGTATAEASCEVQDHLPHGACLQICLVWWGISLFWLRSLFSVHGRLVAAPGSGLQFRARLWLLHGCGRLGWVLNVVVVLGKSSLDYLSVSVAMEPSGIMFPLGGIAKELPPCSCVLAYSRRPARCVLATSPVYIRAPCCTCVRFTSALAMVSPTVASFELFLLADALPSLFGFRVRSFATIMSFLSHQSQ
jgi:hypothetical protein